MKPPVDRSVSEALGKALALVKRIPHIGKRKQFQAKVDAIKRRLTGKTSRAGTNSAIGSEEEQQHRKDKAIGALHAIEGCILRAFPRGSLNLSPQARRGEVR